MLFIVYPPAVLIPGCISLSLFSGVAPEGRASLRWICSIVKGFCYSAILMARRMGKQVEKSGNIAKLGMR